MLWSDFRNWGQESKYSNKRCSHCSCHAGNPKGLGSCEPGTMDEHEMYMEVYFGHLNDQIYVSYKSQYCSCMFNLVRLLSKAYKTHRILEMGGFLEVYNLNFSLYNGKPWIPQKLISLGLILRAARIQLSWFLFLCLFLLYSHCCYWLYIKDCLTFLPYSLAYKAFRHSYLPKFSLTLPPWNC